MYREFYILGGVQSLDLSWTIGYPE